MIRFTDREIEMPARNCDPETAKIFSSGEVAKMFSVASRTVTQWCDKGILECYHIPGGNHRRITREALIRFAKGCSMPFPECLKEKP